MKLVSAIVLGVFAISCPAQEGAKQLYGRDTSSSVTLPPQGPVTRPAPPRRPTDGPPVPPVAENGVTGLRYWIELKNTQGQLLRVPATRVFHSGEHIRIHVESNVDGSLVILQSQDNGPFTTLFPNRAGVSGQIARYQDQMFPSKEGWFRFDNKPGDIRLMMMVQSVNSSAPPIEVATTPPVPSPRPPVVVPIPAPQAPSPVPTTRPAPSAADADRLEARMRAQLEQLKGHGKGLEVEEDTTSAEPATYVVVDTRKAGANVEKGVVACELRLVHR